MHKPIDAYCGLSCEACVYREPTHCGGCITTLGNLFHGSCPLAECVQGRHIDFCGECGEFPCDLLTRYSHDETHGDTPKGARIERCRQIKAALVKEAREGLDPVSYCGHHCDYCLMSAWCGGCRSDYNGCSYATICADRVCPNVACATGRGLDGCTECDDLATCELGYYSKKGEVVAKATALFVKEHGKERYTKALRSAIDGGLEYPKSFDRAGSVESALGLLEQYL